MKELLISKGFCLKQYPDGFFWVWITEDLNFMDAEYTIYQCTEGFKDFTLCRGAHVYELSEGEFISEVEDLS